MKYKREYVVVVILLILVISLGYYFVNKSKNTYTESSSQDAISVPIIDWLPYKSPLGFSFMYPTSFKVEANDTSIKVGGIIVKVEKLNCKNPVPSNKITDKTTL